MKALLIVGAALAGVLLFLLATASSADSALFVRHYPLLLGLNAALAVGLAALLGVQLAALLRRLRADHSRDDNSASQSATSGSA